MAAGEDDVHVRFGASIDELKSKMSEVQGIFKEVVEKFAAFGAAVAGGKAFKSMIDEVNKLNGEATKLSKTLGITGEEAGTLITALDDIGADVPTYTDAFVKFNRQLRSNADEMRAMGVDVDALKSGQKDSNEVFQEALQIVQRYKPGIDQTQAAMTLFGRSVDDVQKLMKLNSEKLEDARRKNQELNLTITQEGLAASKRYKEAMNDVGDVIKGLEVTIGKAVIPRFTEMAEKLAAVGPVIVEAMEYAADAFVAAWDTLSETVGIVWGLVKEVLGYFVEGMRAAFGQDSESLSAMEVFKNALRVVQIAFIGFRTAVELVVQAVRTGLTLLGQTMVGFANVAKAVFTGDFAGAKAAWQEAIDERRRILEEGMDAAVKIARKGAADMDAAATNPMERKTGTAAGSLAGKGTQTMRIGRDDSTLAAQAQLQKAMNEASLALTLEYLKQSQAALDDGYKHDLVSTKDYYDNKLAIENAGINASIEAKRRELDAARKAEAGATKPEAKLKFQAEEQKLLGEINVLEAQRNEIVRKNAQEYADAEKQRADALATIRANAQKTAADHEIDIERGAIEQRKALREIDAEASFEQERALEQRSYQATMQLMAAKRAQIRAGDEAALAQQHADEEAAEQAHQRRLIDIDRRAELEKRRLTIQTQQAVQSSFADMLGNLGTRIRTLGDALRHFGTQVAQTFQRLIAQKFAERLFGAGSAGGKLVEMITQPVFNALDLILGKTVATEAAKTAATEEGVLARVAAETWGAMQSVGITVAAAAKNILAKAYEVFAGVYSAIAGIPYVGPFLAPVMAGAALATVVGTVSHLASAEKGWWQVPGDQVAQIHKNEMVLPAGPSSALRNLLSGGGEGGMEASGQPVSITYAPTIHALDGPSVRRVLKSHPEALAEAVGHAMRNGHLTGVKRG